MKRRLFYCSNAACERRWSNVGTKICRACGRENTRLTRIAVGTRLNFIADVPVHFNDAFGCEVRGGRHLRALQKQHGTVDYEPLNSNAPPAQTRRDYKRKRKGTRTG